MQAIILKQPFEISFTGNPIPFSFAITPYRDTEKTQDIRLQVRVMIEEVFGSNFFTEVKSQNFYPNALGLVELDVHTIIDPYLDFYLPTPTLQKAVQCYDQRCRFKVSYLLQKDNNVVGSVLESGIFYAIKGGLAYQEWHPSEFFTNVILADKKPLLFTGDKTKIGADEKHFFYWIYPYNNVADQSIKFTIKLNGGSSVVLLIDQDGAYIVDADGSMIAVSGGGSASFITYDHPQTVSGGKWSVFCMPSGFNQTGLNALVPIGSYAISYAIEVNAGSVQVVAPVTFIIDHRNFYNTHEIIYRNSVGGMETIRLRGQVDFEADYTMQQALRIVPPSYFHNMTVLSQSIQDDNEETAKFTGDTGFISKTAADKLRDLFLSPERYEVYNDRLIPVILNNKNVKFFSNKENLISVQIQWIWAFTNAYYTPGDLMPVVRACPAVETFVVQQVSKNMLQIMYALVSPYEIIEVQVIVGATTNTYTYRANATTVLQPFVSSGNSSIIIKARTVCDENSTPVDYGPYTIINLNVSANSLPVVSDDTFTINSGFNSAIVLQGSTLANDYDPDGDAIEVLAASGTTNANGTYSINAAGIVTYTPPSSVYSGNDHFNYQVREVGGSVTVTGKVTISVGSAGIGVFAKIVYRNLVSNQFGIEFYTNSEVWIDFFGDPAGTQPLDVTALNLTVNYRETLIDQDNGGAVTTSHVDKNVQPVGIKVKIYDGLIYSFRNDQDYITPVIHTLEHLLLAGTGYTPI